MAKNAGFKNGGPARVRLVVLDAEVADGDLSSLTQAIQNALRPHSTTVVQRNSSLSGPKTIQHQAEPDDEVLEVDDVADEAEATPRVSKPRAARKTPKSPEVVDIDMNADVSFSSFVAGKKTDSVANRYMIAAAWLHECRGIASVTDGHIYTCFRSIGWPTNIADFGQPLRDLKGRKYFTNPERGLYAINHLGLDYVKKLGGSDGVG